MLVEWLATGAMELPLRQALVQWGLTRYVGRLEEAGVHSLADFACLDAADLKSMGVSDVHKVLDRVAEAHKVTSLFFCLCLLDRALGVCVCVFSVRLVRALARRA